MKWHGKNAHPEYAGWFYVRETWPKLRVSVRYYDDSRKSWWAYSQVAGLVPNDSFHDWLNIPNVTDRQRV